MPPDYGSFERPIDITGHSFRARGYGRLVCAQEPHDTETGRLTELDSGTRKFTTGVNPFLAPGGRFRANVGVQRRIRMLNLDRGSNGYRRGQDGECHGLIAG